jgi:hypothetical protein
MRHAEQMWFSTALRARLPDNERQMWKDRFVARSISLRARWRHMYIAARFPAKPCGKCGATLRLLERCAQDDCPGYPA